MTWGLANKSEGRTFSCTCYIKLAPPDMELGETDAMMEIGKGLVNESLRLLLTTAEAEGFTVTIDVSPVVY